MKGQAKQATFIKARLCGNQLGADIEERSRQQHAVLNNANSTALFANEEPSRAVSGIGNS